MNRNHEKNHVVHTISGHAGDDGQDDIGEEELQDREDLMQLYEKSLKGLEEGNVVQGEVVDVGNDVVLVDIGYKSEGEIPRREFVDSEGNLAVQTGDKVDVVLIRKDEEGYPILSREEAEKTKRLDEIEKINEKDQVITGTIISRVKGGFTVDIGFKAFLPASQVDIRPVKNLDAWVGGRHRFKIVKFDKRARNVVLSRRVCLEEERRRQRAETLQRIENEAVLEGTIKNITDYGLFVDLGGVDGLVHISDMAWGKVRHPSKLYRIGDPVTVKVLEFDPETQKVSLGIKQLTPDPWDNVAEKYPIGATVNGRVINLKNYGAFVELEEGVVGLIHVSDMSWTQKIRNPNQVVKVGDEVQCIVLHLDIKKREMALGLKQLEPNPWDSLEDHYPVGAIIEGKVKKVTDFGIFIGIAEGINGMVHISDMSWTRNVKHPSELYQKGQSVRAVVLDIDRANERVTLGIKQLTPDPWQEIPRKYKPGTSLKGKVVNITDFGLFVEIEEGIDGLVHVSEIPISNGEDPLARFQPGDEVETQVVDVSPEEKKIRLSMKAGELNGPEERPTESTTRFGKLLQEKIQERREEKK